MKKIIFCGINIIWICSTIVLYKINNISWRLLLLDLRTGFIDTPEGEYNFLLISICLVIFMVYVACLIYSKKIILQIKIKLLKKNRSYVIGKFTWWRSNGIWICLIVFLVSLICSYYCGVFRFIKKSMWGEPLTVAHAGGRIGGDDYSNSVDAILENYKLGQRVFEIDFCVTADNYLVGKHDWDYVVQDNMISGEAVSRKKFLESPIFGKYEPLDFEKLCLLLDEYPDMWIVTDTKEQDLEIVQNQFEIMKKTADELGMQNVLDRIVVQVYNEQMYDTISKIYLFKEYIFTLYQFWSGDCETFLECARYSYSKGIRNITIWNYRVNEEVIEIANRYNIHLYAHTEDNIVNAKKMIGEGLTGVYTNTILPKEIIER